ncbi:MAG: hypothetical protein DRJ18_01465, partial [Candidatus Methanomethylicota archaeon]
MAESIQETILIILEAIDRVSPVLDKIQSRLESLSKKMSSVSNSIQKKSEEFSTGIGKVSRRVSSSSRKVKEIVSRHGVAIGDTVKKTVSQVNQTSRALSNAIRIGAMKFEDSGKIIYKSTDRVGRALEAGKLEVVDFGSLVRYWSRRISTRWKKMGRILIAVSRGFYKAQRQVLWMTLSFLGLLWQTNSMLKVYTRTIMDVISPFSNWTSTVERAVEAIAYLTVAGYDTEAILTGLGIRFDDLINLGIQTKAVFGLLYLNFLTVAEVVWSKLLPVLQELAVALYALITETPLLDWISKIVEGFAEMARVGIREWVDSVLREYGTSLDEVKEKIIGKASEIMGEVTDRVYQNVVAPKVDEIMNRLNQKVNEGLSKLKETVKTSAEETFSLLEDKVESQIEGILSAIE